MQPAIHAGTKRAHGLREGKMRVETALPGLGYQFGRQSEVAEDFGDLFEADAGLVQRVSQGQGVEADGIDVAGHAAGGGCDGLQAAG